MTTSGTITKTGRTLAWRKKRLRTDGRRSARQRLAASYPYRALAVCIIAITLQPELGFRERSPLAIDGDSVIDRAVRLFAYLSYAPRPFVMAVALETQNPP